MHLLLDFHVEEVEVEVELKPDLHAERKCCSCYLRDRVKAEGRSCFSFGLLDCPEGFSNF